MTDKSVVEREFDLPEEQFYFLYSVIATVANNDQVTKQLKDQGMYSLFKGKWDAATKEERIQQLSGMYQLAVQAAEVALVATNLVRHLGGESLIVAEAALDEPVAEQE